MSRGYKISKFNLTIKKGSNTWKVQNFQIYTSSIELMKQHLNILNITQTQEIFSQNLFKNLIYINNKTYKDNHEKIAVYRNKYIEATKKNIKNNTQTKRPQNEMVIIAITKQENISKLDWVQEVSEMHSLIDAHNVAIIIKIKQDNQDEEKIAQHFKKFNQTWAWTALEELMIYKDRRLDLDIKEDSNYMHISNLIAIIKNQQTQVQNFKLIIAKQKYNDTKEYFMQKFGRNWIINLNKQVKNEVLLNTDYKQIYKYTIEINPEALVLKNTIMMKQYLSVARNEILNEQIQQIIQAFYHINSKEYFLTTEKLAEIIKKTEILRKKRYIEIKQGKIDSKIVQQTFLGNTRRNLWSVLADYYKHQKKEIFFAQQITKTVWRQIAEFFRAELTNYKPYRINLSMTIQTGYQKYISPSQICVPKSNAIDLQGFNAKYIIASLTRNMIKKSGLRDENGNPIVIKKWVNILLGPYIASILSNAGYENIARTFYFLKKDEININDFSKIRLLYILPMTIRIFESTIFDVISRSIAKKVNEVEEINFGSIKGSSPMRMIQELKDIYYNNPNAAIIQCDISKAFDTVRYDILRQATDYYYGNEDQNLLQTKNALYRKLILKWIEIIENMGTYNNKNTKYIYKSQGVPMGSSMAPIMFVMYLNYALRNYQYKRISYCDDTYIIVSQNTEEIKKAIRSLEEELEKANMRLNISKSKLIVQNANANEQIQKLQIQLSIQIKSTLDILGMVLSMSNLTQIRNQTNVLINFKDIIATNLPYSIVTNIIKNALMLPTYYRAKATNDISAEIFMVMSIVFKRIQDRWKFINIKHIHLIVPNFIQLLAIKDLRSGTQGQRQEYMVRLNSYDSYFTNNEKTLLLQMLKSAKISEEDEMSNEELIENKMKQYIFLDEQQRRFKRAELETEYAQREYGYTKWLKEFKQKIQRLYPIKDYKIQQIWGYYTENTKQVWYLWFIKFIDEITRTPADNFIFRVIIKTHEIIQRDLNLERYQILVENMQKFEYFNHPANSHKHTKKGDNKKQIKYEEISSEEEARKETTNKKKNKDKTAKQINQYMRALEMHYEYMWQLLDEYILEIEKQLKNHEISLQDLTLEEEVKMIEFIDDANYNIKIVDSDETPYMKLLRATKKKACKIIALASDTIISSPRQSKWNQTKQINDFISLLKLYTGKNSYNDNRKYHLLDMELEGLINKEVF